MRAKRILGLDLGRFAYKAVLLEIRGTSPRLLRAALAEALKPGDRTAAQAALKALLSNFPLHGIHRIVGVVDDPFVALRQVLIPLIPPAEVEEAIRWELMPYLAVPSEEAIVAYQSLGEVEVGGVKKLKILAAGVPRATVKEELEFLSALQVKPNRLIPKAMAVASWFARSHSNPSEPVALLEVGYAHSELLVLKGGHPIFVRKIPVAGGDMTKGLAATLATPQGNVQISLEEAEAIKRSAGIPSLGSAEIDVKGISGPQLLSLIRGALERLATEVERSLTFYEESTGEKGVPRLILIGGGSHMKGLSQWLSSRLELTVTVPDPWGGLGKAPEALEEKAATSALSLIPALGAALSTDEGVNLLPSEWGGDAARKVRRATFTGALTAGLVMMGLLWSGIQIYRQNLLKGIAVLALEQRAVAMELAYAKAALAAQERRSQEPDWTELFRRLSLVIPDEIYLSGLAIQERQLTLQGRVRQTDRPSDLILADFMRTLGQGLSSSVSLVSSRRLEESSETEFEIRCHL